MSNDQITAIRAKFPFPWVELVHPNGLVQMRDATGQEVSLFALTAFASIVTGVMAAGKQEKAA